MVSLSNHEACHRTRNPMFPHFLAAQDPIYPTVLAELRAGDKQTHWMLRTGPQGKIAPVERF